MRILIFHGYLLGGTGSNVYNARLAAALVGLGHEVHLLCQDRHPQEHPFVDAYGDWDEGVLRMRLMDVSCSQGQAGAGAGAGAGGAGANADMGVDDQSSSARFGTEAAGSDTDPQGSCTVYRPNIGSLLPVYVADRYEGIEARTFADCTDAEVARYIDANIAAVREVAALVSPDIALANHLVMGPVILARALGGDALGGDVLGGDVPGAVVSGVGVGGGGVAGGDDVCGGGVPGGGVSRGDVCGGDAPGGGVSGGGVSGDGVSGGAVPYAVKVHGSALEYTVKPHPERFLELAREGVAGARTILVGSRHTAMSLWRALDDPTLERRTRLGPPGVDVELFRPRDPEEAAAGLRELIAGLRSAGSAPASIDAPSEIAMDGDATVREAVRGEVVRGEVVREAAVRGEEAGSGMEAVGGEAVRGEETGSGQETVGGEATVREPVSGEAVRDATDSARTTGAQITSTPSAFARDELAAADALERLRPADDQIVAFVGKLIVNKGIDLLLASWPLVLARLPQAKLVVVGFGADRTLMERLLGLLADGDLRRAQEIALPHLRAFLGGLRDDDNDYVAAARSLPERVVFTGRLDHDELAELLPVCEALVVPSTFPEAFGMVAVEAAACGALPISASHSGLAEVSDVLAGAVPACVAPLLSFPVDDSSVTAIADRILAWLQIDPAVRERARTGLVATVRERWSWPGVARGVIAAARGELDDLPAP